MGAERDDENRSVAFAKYLKFNMLGTRNNHKPMKRISIFIILAICLLSCNRIEDGSYLSFSESLAPVLKGGKSDTIASLDSNPFRPYDLASMQKEFDNYLGVSDSIFLPPTHQAIILHLNSMRDLHAIEADSSLIVFPFVFGEPISSAPSIRGASHSSAVQFLFAEGNDQCEEIVNDYSVNVSSSISVLWPLNKQLADTLSYDFCYNAFVPEYYHMIVGEQKSEIVCWVNSNLQSRSTTGFNLPSRLSSFDNRLNDYVALKNVAIFIVRSSNFASVSTDSNGYFTIPGNLNYDDTSLYCVLLDCNSTTFCVRDSVSNNAIILPLGTIGDTYHNSVPALFKLPWSFETDIYQAAWYYFHGSNDELDTLTSYSESGNSIDIYAIETGNAYGRFFYHVPASASHLPRISIYRAGRTSSSQIFGTVLHELGHASHYISTNLPSTFANITPFIKESFASFTGWYNVKCFYSSVATTDSAVNNICSQGRQSWNNTITTGLNYTPLFVDLHDSYNQSLII